MTVNEAIKVIDMCADTVKYRRDDSDNIYVNKDYVLDILKMIDKEQDGTSRFYEIQRLSKAVTDETDN